MTEKLQAELPGILRWAVEGCLAWQRDGLGEPAAVASATKDYRTEQDTVARFLADCCKLDRNATVKAKTLFEAFQGWCDANGERFGSQRAFGLGLKSKGYSNTKSDGITVWLGLELNPDGERLRRERASVGSKGTKGSQSRDESGSDSHGDFNPKTDPQGPYGPAEQTRWCD